MQAQSKCFGAPLQQQEVEGIKEMVRERAPEGVRDEGLTEAGFLFLHTVFIQRARLETTWTVLRKFGYGEDLKLTEAFLQPKHVCTLIYPSCLISVSGLTCLPIARSS